MLICSNASKIRCAHWRCSEYKGRNSYSFSFFSLVFTTASIMTFKRCCVASTHSPWWWQPVINHLQQRQVSPAQTQHICNQLPYTVMLTFDLRTLPCRAELSSVQCNMFREKTGWKGVIVLHIWPINVKQAWNEIQIRQESAVMWCDVTCPLSLSQLIFVSWSLHGRIHHTHPHLHTPLCKSSFIFSKWWRRIIMRASKNSTAIIIARVSEGFFRHWTARYSVDFRIGFWCGVYYHPAF